MASPAELTWDQLNNVQRWTAYGGELEERIRKGIQALDGNEFPQDERARLAHNECPRCWYLRGPTISGQAFWPYKCGICGEEKMHHNTDTPRYCHECCRAFALCGSCGGTIDCKARRTGKRRK